MKQSKTTIKELKRRYCAVLLKCVLMNMAITYTNPSVASEQIYYLTPHDGYKLSGQWNPAPEVDTVHFILQGNGETLNGNNINNDISFVPQSVTLDISNISQLVNYAKAINLSGVSGVLNIYSDNEMHFNGNGSDIEIFDGTANLHSGSIYFEKGITGSKSTYNYNIGKTVNSVLNIEGATAIFESGS